MSFDRELKLDPAGLGRVILRVGIVMAVIVAADTFIRYRFSPVRIAPYPVRLLLAWRNPAPPDIVFLGSSRPRENIDDGYVNERLRRLGYGQRSANLAFSGGGASVLARQFREQIRPMWRAHPTDRRRLVVIDLNELEIHAGLINEEMLREFDHMNLWLGRFADLRGLGLIKDTLRHGMAPYQKLVLDAVTIPVFHASAIYQFNGDWSKKEEARKWVRRKLLFWRGGGGENLKPPAQGIRLMGVYTVSDTHLQDLERLISDIRADGAVPVVTALPVASWRKQYYAAGMEARFEEIVTDLCGRLNVPRVRVTNEEAGLTDESYFDDVHLKRSFRPKVSEKVLEKAVVPALEGNLGS